MPLKVYNKFLSPVIHFIYKALRFICDVNYMSYIIRIINNHIVIEMDVLKSDESKTLHEDEEETDEMTPLKTELTDKGKTLEF